ncbi:MAG: hypothetical protein RDU14_15245, partial [Melioribacteraceae bacterium]|nr:hypothetical protein [Melioribacteraceae bacterium]
FSLDPNLTIGSLFRGQVKEARALLRPFITFKPIAFFIYSMSIFSFTFYSKMKSIYNLFSVANNKKSFRT